MASRTKPSKRDAILDAMLDVVVERGFHEAPMSLIAERSSTSAGFGAVAAKRLFDAPNTKLILEARDNKNFSIDILPLDLAHLSSVRSFVQSLTKKLDGTKIDSLIMNAGAQFGNTGHRTGDGFESTFAINHLAHYLLLRLLTPSLSEQDGA